MVLTGTGFALGTVVHSPWETAADNAARTPVVTATVEVRQFTTPVATATGVVRTGSITDVLPAAADDRTAVVTAAPLAAGAIVSPGSAIIEVSDRPVIALPLAFTLYRDLAPGDSGSDVRTVQEALSALGLYTGAVDGTYGTATATAVRALYAQNGVTAPSIADDLTAAVADARTTVSETREQVSSAQRDRDRAARAVDQAAADPESTQAILTEAQAALADADAALSTATAAATTAEADLAAAQAAADTPLPRSEIVVAPAEGCSLVSVAAVGTVLGSSDEESSTAAARLLSGDPTATVRVKVADADPFAVGAAVTITATTDASSTASGHVTAVSDFSTSSTRGEFPGYDVTVSFSDPSTVPFEDGASVAAVPTDGASVATHEGLAVPLVTLRSDGDQVYVLRTTQEEDPDSAQRIDVTVETTSDGYALVATDELANGDALIVEDAS